MLQGIDTAAKITAEQAKKLKSEGISFVCRYLVPQNMWKAITEQEIIGLREAGLAILLCWEIGGADVKGGSTKGTLHGTQARQLAEKYGVPSGTTIYFAVDYNIQQSDFIYCEQYILAAQTAMGSKYSVGLYGPQKIVEFLSERGSCKRFWQCLAWSAKFLPSANVKQYKEQNSSAAKAIAKKAGIQAVDLDECDDMRKAGMWMPPYTEYKDDSGDTIYAPPTENTQNKPWYADAMAWVESNGIMADGRPLDNMTRAELATVLMRYDNLIGEKIKMHLPENNSHGGIISE